VFLVKLDAAQARPWNANAGKLLTVTRATQSTMLADFKG